MSNCRLPKIGKKKITKNAIKMNFFTVKLIKSLRPRNLPFCKNIACYVNKLASNVNFKKLNLEPWTAVINKNRMAVRNFLKVPHFNWVLLSTILKLHFQYIEQISNLSYAEIYVCKFFLRNFFDEDFSYANIFFNMHIAIVYEYIHSIFYKTLGDVDYIYFYRTS